MAAMLRMRELTEEEREQIKRLSQSRTAPLRAVERARIVQLASEGVRVSAIAERLHIAEKVARRWVTRFNAAGMTGLADKPRSGRPATYSREEIGVVVATALTDPKELDLPFGSWTLDRLVRLSERSQREHRDQTQPDQRDPARGGTTLASAGGLVR